LGLTQGKKWSIVIVGDLPFRDPGFVVDLWNLDGTFDRRVFVNYLLP
jgi:hypothetical protein